LNRQPSGYEPDELPTAPSRVVMVEGEGFEPSKAVPTDLQSAPFGRLGIPPLFFTWSRAQDLNPQPADYKSAALPIELARLSK
jgi:hypothetical protein